MADEALDPALQRDSRGGAARAGAVHGKEQSAVAVALVGDIAAVLRDRWPHPSLDQLLDLVDDVGVFRILFEGGLARDVDSRGAAGDEHWRAADEMVEQGLEHERLEV